ncbi:hypothetical protein AAAT94_10220, partial [Intestinimonas aquisgranensis]
MDIIKLEASENGYRPAIQSDWVGEIPPGYIEVPEGTDTSAMQEYGGFIELTIDEDGTLTAITGNKEAYQAYMDSRPPEPEPVPTEAQALGREITAMELESIAQGQKQTALELDLLEQGQYITDMELEGL